MNQHNSFSNLSEIQQISQTNNQTNLSISNNENDNDNANENDVRKRIIESGKSSIIWSEFDIIEIRDGTETQLDLCDIFNNPRPNGTRMFFKDTFKETIASNSNEIF